MTKGGSLPYKKGAAWERVIRDHYEIHDWIAVRQPKSQSPFDIMAIRGTTRHLVQCKLAGKIPRKEKEELLEMSSKFGFRAVLAWRDKGIKLRYLDGEGEEFRLDDILD